MAISVGGAILGAAGIGAAASIGGQLLAGKRSGGSIGQTVKQATAAGIHPLYALGAGYNPPAMPSSGSGLGEGISRAGEALAGGGEAYARNLRAEASFAGDQNMDMARHGAQMKKLAAETDYILQNTEFTKHKMLQDRLNYTGIGRGSFPPGPAPNPMVEGVQTGRQPKTGYAFDPGVSDADVMEGRIGEISDFTYGPWVALKDHYYNMQINRYADQFRPNYKSPYRKVPPSAWGGP